MWKSLVSAETLTSVKKEIKLFQEAMEFETKKTNAQKKMLDKVKDKKKKPEFEDRRRILNLIGREAERRYKYNLAQTGYQGEIFKHAFKWEPDEDAFLNYYYLDAGSQRLNQILQYLEYGTGLYGSIKSKWIESTKISPRTGKRLLLKFKYEGDFIYKRRTRGIKPGFMFTKAVESVNEDMPRLIQYYSKSSGR